MPRKRPKTRLDHLADALEAAEKASLCLQSIDLRTTSGVVRESIKAARGHADGLGEAVAKAMRNDLPSPVPDRRRLV